MSHTLEPWVLGDKDRHGDTPINANDWHELATVVTRMHGEAEQCAEGVANARRIVVCVNAMAGIDDPQTWVDNARFYSHETVSAITRQRDELLTALGEIAWSNDSVWQAHRAKSAIAKAEVAK